MSGIGRASALIGAGTIVSRLTGFLRTIVLVAAIGSTTAAGNAFTIANQLPNNIYAIISTGILTAVIVPQIVRSAAHPDGGNAFVSKLLTLGTIVLLGATALALLFAPQLIQLYGVAVTFVWSAGISFILLKLVGLFVPLRVSREHELEGLDISQHGEALQ